MLLVCSMPCIAYLQLKLRHEQPWRLVERGGRVLLVRPVCYMWPLSMLAEPRSAAAAARSPPAVIPFVCS